MMSNVVSIGLPRRPNLVQRQTALLENFALHRRTQGDVFWLKENAEILNILASTGTGLGPKGLQVYRSFYDGLEEKMRFFPQYYRFLLSICLDLEDLGYDGDKGKHLCAMVERNNFVAAELSDLQRAETQRLLRRRGIVTADEELSQRLIRFIEHSEIFALPNKKAAYELTHIVFYLSDYGNAPLTLSRAALTSLEFAGVLAYLDQDIDLLSEICVALRFAGQTPSTIWEDWLAHEVGGFVLAAAPAGAMNDAYHEYLVTSWWAGMTGMAGFQGQPQTGGLEIRRCNTARGPLRAISEVMYQLGTARSRDWTLMRGILERSLEASDHDILRDAEQSSPQFSEFFEEFARAY
ncbi:MAG: hypothetical protein AB8B47_11455 [Roseobacter sp.]